MEPIKLETVTKVYSGINGKCCCGCSGKYSYPNRDIEAAGKERGYALDADDINEKEVKRITGIINKNLDKAESDIDGMAHVVIGKRLYMVCFKTK